MVNQMLIMMIFSLFYLLAIFIPLFGKKMELLKENNLRKLLLNEIEM